MVYDRCGVDGDYLSLYLHLDRPEVNEGTASNVRLCSLPARQSSGGAPPPPPHPGGSQPSPSGPVKYFSALSTLVMAFHTQRPSSVAANGSSSSFPYGFNGTYRFIRRSKCHEKWEVTRTQTLLYIPPLSSLIFDAGQFRSDGQRIAGSACDYQFISQQSAGPGLLRKGKFYSPLYPSLYPARSRCFYHFYGRSAAKEKLIGQQVLSLSLAPYRSGRRRRGVYIRGPRFCCCWMFSFMHVLRAYECRNQTGGRAVGREKDLYLFISAGLVMVLFGQHQTAAQQQ